MRVETQKWHVRAACAGLPFDWWPEDKEQGAEGKQMCATCPKVASCLDDAVGRNEHGGIRGGPVRTFVEGSLGCVDAARTVTRARWKAASAVGALNSAAT